MDTIQTESTKKRSLFTGTWYSNTFNIHQATFRAFNLNEAKRYAQIYKHKANLKGKTIVTKNYVAKN